MNEIPSQDPADGDSLAGTLRSVFRKMLMGVDAMLPARVVTYDRERNVATVQPIIKVVAMSGDSISRAMLAEIPVLALGGGEFVINFPLKPGDLGWIEASDRDISLYMQGMQEANPNTMRLHSFEDGRFIPDVFRQYKIDGADEGDMVIQTLDGATKIVMSQTEIRMTAASAVKIVAQDVSIEAGNTVKISSGGTVSFRAGGNLGISAAGGASMESDGGSTIDGKIFLSHTHRGVQTGGSNTGGVS